MHNDDAPRSGCYCAACHWARTGERTRVREESTSDIAENYAAYQAGQLGDFDLDGYVASRPGRE